MHLWHILSVSRLAQKKAFARSSKSSDLLLSVPELRKDVSYGKLGKFLYCVPSLVGAGDFAPGSELRAIRIELKSDVRIAKFRGDPDHIDYASFRRTHDAMEMFVDARPKWPIRFFQVLLWNSESIENWTSEGFATAFREEFSKLKNGEMPIDAFFIPDFTEEERLAQASVLAFRFGISVEGAISAPEASKILRAAERRVGMTE